MRSSRLGEDAAPVKLSGLSAFDASERKEGQNAKTHLVLARANISVKARIAGETRERYLAMYEPEGRRCQRYVVYGPGAEVYRHTVPLFEGL